MTLVPLTPAMTGMAGGLLLALEHAMVEGQLPKEAVRVGGGSICSIRQAQPVPVSPVSSARAMHR